MAEQHLDRNPRIGKAFQIRRHRLLEIDLSLAGQHQHRRSGDRLGDGSQLKTGRNRQFFPRAEVGIPVRLGENLVPLGKEHHAVELSANSPGGKVLVDLFGLILFEGLGRQRRPPMDPAGVDPHLLDRPVAALLSGEKAGGEQEEKKKK